MKPTSAETLRKKELGMIHVAISQLGMDDDSYRALLLRVTKKSSSKDLTWQERKAVMDDFKRLGFKVKAKAAGRSRPNVGPDRMPRMRKIEALLAEAGRPWAYLDPLVKNLKRASIQFCDCDDLSKIIAALMKDAQRNGRSEG